MKHAGSAALQTLAPLLQKVRKHTLAPGARLREKKLGTFYLKSKAFLHFHEDPAGMFADVKLGNDFIRFRATTPREQRELIARIDEHLAP